MSRFMGSRCRAALSALCLLAAFAARAQMQIDNSFMFQNMTSSKFVWIDSNGNQRTAVLAHNDQSGPLGTHGGELREFKYQVGGNTRDVIADVTQAAAGFGYVVSHNSGENHCTGGGDASTLGHIVPGTWTLVFQGRHHAILRFQQNYPRYCTDQAPAAENDLPVTVDWVFSTGRDNPLWALTWDLSGVGADVLNDDSRAPYGELMFDGASDMASQSDVAGVGWGDGFKFRSTTNPVTFSSDWDWSTPNTIPYVKLWTTAVDATMGTVMTQTIRQQDAGGYFDASRWGSTSAAGEACAGQYTMPCDYNWDYQSINYSIGLNASTSNTRLAWGTEFGFLGQTTYYPNGSAQWGGTDPTWPQTASGYPTSKKKSYSTYIVLGTHTAVDSVETQVAQVEAIQHLTMSINGGLGSVVTTGPAGVADATSFTYDPPGYNHVYGALALSATNNQIDANINLSAGDLKNPLIIVSNYTGGSTPTVSLNGNSLAADIGYFASTRTNPNELWITLNADLAGANRLVITGSSGPPPAPANVKAIASTNSRIDLSWDLVAGATYQVDRQAVKNGAFTQIATGVVTNSYSDTSLPAGTAFVYRVRAVTASGTSPNSALHLGITVVYSDNPLSAGIFVNANHLLEIRSALTAVCHLSVTCTPSFPSGAVAGGTIIQAANIAEIRSQLDPALSALNIPTSGYTDNSLAGIPVQAVHFQEIRNRMQ